MVRIPALGWIQYEPLGVVLIVGPWNGPVNLVLNPLVAAVAAGNCAVVKPSELTPATSRLSARLIPEYLDPVAVAVVEGDGTVTQDVLAQGVDHCFFINDPQSAHRRVGTELPDQAYDHVRHSGGREARVVRHAREITRSSFHRTVSTTVVSPREGASICLIRARRSPCRSRPGSQ